MAPLAAVVGVVLAGLVGAALALGALALLVFKSSALCVLFTLGVLAALLKG